MGERAKVLSQKLSNASLKEFTLAQDDALRSILDLFPQSLETGEQADLKLLNDVDEEIPFIVTASIQGPEIAPRLVLLQERWEPVVEKLHLKEGDTVSIFLSNRDTWTYSIQVEKAEAGVEADQGDADEEVTDAAEVLISMGTSAQRLVSMDTSGLQLLADCALEQGTTSV